MSLSLQPPPTRTGARGVWPALDIAAVVFGLWLAGSLPIALSSGEIDEGHFAAQAMAIRHGLWLGHFDSMTLAKGAFFPMFLAGSAACGLPFHVAVEAVYLCGAWLLSRAAGRVLGKAYVGSLCLWLLAANPATFHPYTVTLMREPLYTGLVTLVLGLAARVFLLGGGMFWALLLGVATAAFWLTREEGAIVLPPLLLLMAWHMRGPLWAIARRLCRRPPPESGYGPSGWREPLVAVAAALVLVLSLCAVNERIYGVFRATDFQSGPFVRAYGAMSRVIPDNWLRAFPVPAASRARLYAVSEAARALRPVLEDRGAWYYIDYPCGAAAPVCHDVPGTFLIWALRDAVTKAGHYGTARDADAFYKRLAKQIDAACRAGALPCLPRRATILPPLTWPLVPDFICALARISLDVARFDHGDSAVTPPSDEPSYVGDYQDILFATPISAPDIYLNAQGWHLAGDLLANGAPVTLQTRGGAFGGVSAELRQGAISGTGARRFVADLRCSAGCAIVLSQGDLVLGEWPAASLHPGDVLVTPQATLSLSEVAPLAAAARLEGAQAENLHGATMRLLRVAMRWLGCVGAIPAVAWPLYCAWRDVRARRLRQLTVLANFVLLALLLRIAMLALLDVTLIGEQIRFEAPATPMLILLIGIVVGGAHFPGRATLAKAGKQVVLF